MDLASEDDDEDDDAGPGIAPISEADQRELERRVAEIRSRQREIEGPNRELERAERDLDAREEERARGGIEALDSHRRCDQEGRREADLDSVPDAGWSAAY